MYADKEYYSDSAFYGGRDIPEEDIEKYLKKAGRQIDTLTFCRINAIGFDKLTAFQQEQIRYTNCLLADFLYNNEDELETMLAAYGINGVSMTFQNSINVVKTQGIIIRTDIFAELAKTGLCNRRV